MESHSVEVYAMEEGRSPDSLFFELASESRLNMLRELSRSQLKMQEITRKLDLTATEASRQTYGE